MIVYKFGGTSVADAARIRVAAGLVAECSGQRVVVVSALAGVTNLLVRLAEDARSGNLEAVEDTLDVLAQRHGGVARELVADPAELASLEENLDSVLSTLGEVVRRPPASDDPDVVLRFNDAVTAAGEDLSARLMAAALLAAGLDAEAVDAREVVRTDARFGGAVPLDEVTTERVRERLEPLLSTGVVPVLQGYVAATAGGATTTLGRGGSDFTAAIVGASLGARDVIIWTDVDGVLSAEPRQVNEARVLPEMGYEEAVELAYFGARVIHPAAAKHAAARDVSLRIRNTLSPGHPGTLIRSDTRRVAGVAAVAFKPAITLVKVRSRPMFMAYGFLARVFEVLARHRVPVDLVATSHTSTAFTVDEVEDLTPVREELMSFAEVDVVPGLVTVSVVGHGLLHQPGITSRVFSVLGDTPVHLISQASDVSLSFLVEEAGALPVVRRLHTELVEGPEAIPLRREAAG